MSTPNKAPIGVLLMAYGSPRNVDEVAPFLAHIRGGATPSPQAVESLQARYRALGGSTPLMAISEAQAAALQASLDARYGAGTYAVRVSMKHWHPFIADVVAQMAAEGIRDVLAIPLAPHFSKISIGSYIEAARAAADQNGLALTVIEQWHDAPNLIDCIAEQLHESVKNAGSEQPRVIFTAHSLPERIRTWNDPYEAQLQETCRLVAAKAGLASWTFAFQSAVATGTPWLGPSLAEALVAAGSDGQKAVIVCPVGFVSDHLEILYDIDIAAAEVAAKAGVTLTRAASRNTHPSFIAALEAIVTHAAVTTNEKVSQAA